MPQVSATERWCGPMLPRLRSRLCVFHGREPPDPCGPKSTSKASFMRRYLSLLSLIVAFAMFNASAQTPPIEGPVYVATYVEVVPAGVAEGRALLKQYCDDSRNDAGNLRMELVQETGRASRFALLEIW